ncbi:uncharacterized protein LOC130372189 isoform X1 [Gadus chalcogrammus]|uniref:uncharacterized protein LOC130372187 isoform X1 n=2 Tax=Gadus chalcogrammus TaxID=1042646 RepID=UPI0024C48AC8|nr:uncharacterized protein LOC130372187 isoform X1 [Gadus chalcogrammus]XP_056433997.1 uncharacterized protein LOC130372189 isoform X1 [Gadus chalcogrammus]
MMVEVGPDNSHVRRDVTSQGPPPCRKPRRKHRSGWCVDGMLLELPGPALSQMLEDEALLAGALEKALSALDKQLVPSNYNDEENVSGSSDSLGDQLFELVDTYNTGHSHKITGMLLEQHKETVLKLFSEPTLLQEQVNLSLKTLNEQELETCMSDPSLMEDMDRLGENLFLLVERLDSVHATDITGMLLEMDPSTLPQLLRDNKALEGAVRKAQAALENFKSSV